MRIQTMSSPKILASSFVIFVLLPVVVASHPQCGLYGAPTCQFVPAPPGQTPACARPGKTYCEHADNYPTYLIKHLVHKWGFESKSLIIDETTEEFESLTYRYHDITHFFDPASIFGPGANHLGQFEGYKYETPRGQRTSYPEPIYIPKPRDTDSLLSSYLIYSSLATSPSSSFKSKANTGWTNTKVSQYNPVEWLKRYARDLGRRRQELEVTQAESNSTAIARPADPAEKSYIEDIFEASSDNSRHRTKRQSRGRQALCRTNSQFITPQAALNSRGNWMYLVNEMNTARQLVKTETCASSTCSNLCQLPNGYNSRCEQKYVQKRLVALNANGQNLYTDSFWFPSCCVCTLSN